MLAFMAFGHALGGIDGDGDGSWDISDNKDFIAMLKEDEGVAAWAKWVLATRDRIL